MKDKNIYMVDNLNRLVIKRKEKKLITRGRFSVDRNNRLIYWLNEPTAWRRQYGLPGRIVFEGNWKLSPNYDLELNLLEAKGQPSDGCLVLKGEIVSTDRDSLVFQIKSLNRQGMSNFQLIKLSGFWRTDEGNRLSFSVEKKELPVTLTLDGLWAITKNQQIIYKYERVNLKTKGKAAHTLNFEGFWQIDTNNRLTYIISRSVNSRFDFRVQSESPSLYPQDGRIKYRLGIGLRKDKSLREKIISLYGSWKFSRKGGLIFQMDYGRASPQNIEFGANIHLTKKDEFTFSLTNPRREPLGICITFTHRFLKQHCPEAFLRLRSRQKEFGVEAGMQMPF